MPEYNVQSVYALANIPADTDDGRGALTRAFSLWHDDHVQSQWPRAIQAFENVAFLLGNHYARFLYDVQGGLGLSIAAATGSAPLAGPSGGYDDIPKVVDNRLPRAVESMTGLLTETEPAPRVSPNSDSPEDEDGAALSEILLNLVYERPIGMPAVSRDAAAMGAIFEYVIAETEYAETGESIETPIVKMVEGANPFGDEGQTGLVPEITGYRAEFRKDERCRLWSSMHVIPDPGATSMTDAKWFVRTTFEDIDWIRERYEQGQGRTASDGFLLEKDEPIQQVAGSNHPLYWYSRIQDLLCTPQDAYGAGLTASLVRSSGALPNQTLFNVVDVQPSATFPRGRTLVWAGGKLIFAGDARAWSEQYPWRWHPYSYWTWFKVPGRFGGMAMLTELVPLQKRINAIDYLVQKNREFMAIGQWWIPKHAKVKLGSIGGMPGQQYEYNAVQGLSDPSRVQNDPLPAELVQEREMMVSAIEYISSTGALDDQIAQSAARAGVVLDFLRAEKLRNKSPMLRGFEHFLESISQNILIDMQLHLTEEDPVLTDRVRLAAREYSGIAIDAFTGMSLRDHHAVTLDIAAAVRHSPEAKAQKAMEYAQYRAQNLTDAENAAVLQATGLAEFVKSESDASIQRARRMVARIEAGMVQAFLPMNGVDDVFVMAPEFQRAILADRFLNHDPEVQTALLAAFDYYRTAAEQMIQAQMMQQMMMAGQQAPPGGMTPPGAQAGPPAEGPPESA